MDRLGIVSKGFSYSLLAKILLLIFLGGTLSALVLYFVIQENLGGDYATAIISIKNLDNILLGRTLLVYSITGALILAAVALLNLFYSHRIAGPLFRFGREAAKVGSGDLTVKVSLRPKDVVVPLADEITALASRHRERILRLRALTEEIETLSSRSLSLIEQGGSQEGIDESVKAVEAKLQEIESALA